MATRFNPVYAVLNRLWDEGEQSSRGVWGQHTLKNLKLDNVEKGALQHLVNRGYILIFEGAYGAKKLSLIHI